jgi:hypothetical protein
MEMTMVRAKKTPDYLNLPFEVYFNGMWAYGYELFHEIGKNPKKPEDYIGVIYKNSKARGVTFRSENAGDGSLSYVLAGRLDEFAADWLQFIEDEDFDVKSEHKHKFRISKGEFLLGEFINNQSDDYNSNDDDDDDDQDNIDYGKSWQFYSCEGVSPAYLVLDADDTRVVVDSEGYCLAEDDTRIGKQPLVTFIEDEVDGLHIGNKDYQDVRIEIAKFFKN